MFFGSLFTVLLVVAVIVGVMFMGRSFGGASSNRQPPQQPPPPEHTPLDILKERFARGEIDKEEFEERRRMLDK